MLLTKPHTTCRIPPLTFLLFSSCSSRCTSHRFCRTQTATRRAEAAERTTARDPRRTRRWSTEATAWTRPTSNPGKTAWSPTRSATNASPDEEREGGGGGEGGRMEGWMACGWDWRRTRDPCLSFPHVLCKLCVISIKSSAECVGSWGVCRFNVHDS